MSKTTLTTVMAAAEQVGPLTKELEKWRLSNEKATGRKPDGYWHPSSLSGCPTAAFYQQQGFPLTGASFDARLLRIFDVGTAVHQMLQYQLVKANLSPKVKGCDGNMVDGVELPFTVEELRLRGSLDAIVQVPGGPRRVAEVKTKHSASFAKLVVPEPHHILQAASYVIGAEKMGWVDSKEVVFIYFSKDDSRIKELPFTIQDSHFKTVHDRLLLLNSWQIEWDVEGKIPSAYYSEPAKSPCRGCQWAAACHTIERAEWLKKVEALNACATKKQVVSASEKGCGAPAAKPALKLPPRLIRK